MFRMEESEEGKSETYKSRSSAYNDTLNSKLPRRIPLKSLHCRNALARGSIEIAKRSGDRGHPCLVPLPRGK